VVGVLAMLKSLIRVSIFLFLAGTANSAEKCHEDKFVPAHQECETSSSRSADFTTGCRFEEDKWIKVEVECPKAQPQWVNAVSSMSHAGTCAAHGLKPTEISGNICASQYRRPNYGLGWESIVYGSGKKGKNFGGNEVRRAGKGNYWCFAVYSGTAGPEFDDYNRVRAYACE
jgi:hypothetical protein